MITNRIYTKGKSPAQVWEMRARYTPLIVRRAMGQNLTLLLKARYDAKKETIYDKGLKPPGRFTYKLLNGDRPFIEGNVFGVSCNVKSKGGYAYAQRRNDATGYSKRYEVDKTSKFAQLGVKNSSTARRNNIRAAMREVNRLK